MAATASPSVRASFSPAGASPSATPRRRAPARAGSRPASDGRHVSEPGGALGADGDFQIRGRARRIETGHLAGGDVAGIAEGAAQRERTGGDSGGDGGFHRGRRGGKV